MALMFGGMTVATLFVVTCDTWLALGWPGVGRRLTVGDGRIALDWLGSWGARHRERTVADVVRVQCKHYRPLVNLNRRVRLDHLVVRFKTGLPIFVIMRSTGPAAAATAREALAILLGPPVVFSD